MALHRFDTAALPASPWKNGGGTTREIAAGPPGADLASFDWRVSLATIARGGPFSAFPGVDRVIVLMAGNGVRLRGDAVDHRLTAPLLPFGFSGDASIDCELLGGPSTDFNLMTRRGRAPAELRVLRGKSSLQAANAGVLLAVGGAWRYTDGRQEAAECPAGEGLWWQGEARAWQVAPVDDGTALIVVRIETAA